jgi:pimeloyl-ACP methyl ester carboxylesterase/DNA-binding CsgD family transcriptional regulator
VATDVRFFDTMDGATIAYAVEGSGPPLIVLPPWGTHLIAEEALSGHGSFVGVLARQHTVVRYDRWGTGLSSRDRADFSLGADLDVLTGLVEHLRLRRCALVGPSHGAPLAVVFAQRYPRLVSHLVLYGSRASSLTSGETWAALRKLMLVNWPVAARSVSAVATRGSDPSDVDAFAELLTLSAPPQTFVALQDAAIHEDMTALLAQLRVPTLVLHRRADALVSSADAVEVAARIPGCRLELVDGAAHAHSAGNSGLLAERICAFTAGGYRTSTAQVTGREAEVLDLVAQGHSNAEVAERLVLSVRTVERHLLNAYTKLGARGRTDAIARWTGTGGQHSPPTPSA